MKIKKKISVIVFLFLIVNMFMFDKRDSYTEVNNKVVNQNNITVSAFTSAEIQGMQFLQNRMQSPNGLIYYLVETKAPDSYSVLESMGQVMEYAALIGDQQLFIKYAKTTENYFKAPMGYYYWKINIATEQGEPSSALVDDLRVLKAYFIANEKELGKFDNEIAVLSEAIFKFDIDAQGYPCDYYDGKFKQKAKEVSLFYLDVITLEKLARYNKKWLTPYNNAQNVLLNMPENKFGFYPKTFKINANQYSWDSSINMVENLYTAIDAYYAGKDTQRFTTFLKNQIKQGHIYNHYHLDGTSANQDESTAVYALATRLLALNNEVDAADWCYHRTLQFQVSGQNLLCGGFGDKETGLVYAFDQLEALLMLRVVDPKSVRQ